MENTTVAILLFVVGIATIAGIGTRLEIDIVDTLTYEGLWVSFYGVILTFIQVLKLKDTTVATKKAVQETRSQMKLVLSVAQVAKNTSVLRYIKECVTNDKMELARLRLGDVKDFMSEIGYIEGLDYDIVDYKRLVNTIESNLNSLEREINGTQYVDKNIFCQDIEKIVSFLMEIENKLKSK